MITRILLILLLLVVNAHADKYLRADAPGGGNGANWSTAYNTMALLEANLVRGEIGWVADGTYTIGYQIFDVPAAGTTLCTIKKATPGTNNHGTDTGWSDSMGDGQAYFIGNWFIRSNYWLFDGVTGGGPGNWTSGFGFRINSTAGHENIRMDTGSRFCTFRHVELHGAGDGDDGNPGSNDCFSTWDGSSDATLSYAYIIDAGRCPIAIADDNVVIEYVWTGKFESTPADHAETITARQGGDTSGNPGVFNIIVRYNYFTFFRGTGGILFKGNGMYVYGNIFHRFPDNINTSPYGFHGKWDQKPQHNFYAWNNTYIDPYPGGSGQGGSPFFNHYLERDEGTSTSNKNVYNGILFKDAVWTTSNMLALNHDYNHFAQITGTTPNANAGEANGSNSAVDPFVNYQAGNYGLTAAQAAAIPPARDLTGVAPYSTQPGYKTDMFGNIRGGDGKWDRGAIEFVATGGGDVTAPTIFSATIDAQGDDLIVTFNEDVDWKTGNGMTLSSPSGGAVTLSNPQNTGRAEITWDLSRVINSSETAITISYATVANGIEDLALNDLAATTTPFPVTNNTQQGTVQPPLISLVSGFYYGTQNVTLTPQTSGSTIRYTTDNTDPTSSSNLYSIPIPISVPTTLKARAFKSGSTDSTVAAESYSVGTWIFPQTSGDWVDFAVPQQTGTFTWRFRASVSAAASTRSLAWDPLLLLIIGMTLPWHCDSGPPG